MLTLIDGPCEGSYMVKRSPLYLRAVVDKNGEKDVLDQVEDQPKELETVYVYQREGNAGVVHINAAKVKGYFVMANYRYMAEVQGEDLRDNVAWQTWATEHAQGGKL